MAYNKLEDETRKLRDLISEMERKHKKAQANAKEILKTKK